MNETTNNQKVTYKVSDINKAILLLDSIPHTGIETSRVIVEIADILRTNGELASESDSDTTFSSSIEEEN